MTTIETHALGEIISSHFNPGIVVGAYFASFTGCLLTIELLHRRGTSLGSLRSWIETVECALAMGVVGIWCMHFIGNRAITLGDGQENMQLVYAPGFTTLSVFLPVIGLTAAFAAAEIRTAKPLHHWMALSVTGIIAGLSIVGMHYVGNLGVSNYMLSYGPQYLAAAFIIAEGDCLLVLVLFYTWRELWINSWWKRVLCAAFLAGGVSAMHFTASVGCTYRFKMYAVDGKQRDVQVLIAGVLCATAAITFLAYLFATRSKAHHAKKRAQKVVLASAVFDADGRILVNTDGTLPTREITDKYNSISFTDDFNASHPVLHWLFRVSYNWNGVSDLVPRMQTHLLARRAPAEDESHPSSSSSSTVYDPSTSSDHSVVFRERFCVAASNLAASMHASLENVGILYDRIIETGTLSDDVATRRITRTANKSTNELELGVRKVIMGKGQVLFLVREVNLEGTDRLLNSGYRFAHVANVGRAIAESLQIPVTVLESHCASLRSYVSSTEKLDKPGTWLSLFAPIAKAHGHGFDIAVNRHHQNQLPDAQLLAMPPQPWQHDMMLTLDGLKPQACLRILEKRLQANEDDTPQYLRERRFASTVISTIQALGASVPTEWFHQSTFVAKQLQAHYSHIATDHAVPTILYAFAVMGDMHIAIDAYSDIARVPLSFFNMRQRCYSGSPDHQVMAQDIHTEFGPLLGRKIINATPSTRAGRLNISSMTKQFHKQTTAERQASFGDTDTSSENNLVMQAEPTGKASFSPHDSEMADPSLTRDNIWGGILVNSETTVKTDSRNSFTMHPGGGQGITTQSGLGPQVNVGKASQEETFVDELFATTRAKFSPQRQGY
ncbi:hypothetical protein B0A48_14912 [Cryoendolithus antarcticus]|uniref:MHYT domain-containing protein n=1 Tax=Cryoendolithus antarcticus TaxID=1507870 RepID=A0A1V8SJK0_9PEZI|nr:hypothetical protein B0A48_14912 [Cryoendolithus antarcticus]